eukprot:14799660-Ditylum_brightwellii.AAC.1
MTVVIGLHVMNLEGMAPAMSSDISDIEYLIVSMRLWWAIMVAWRWCAAMLIAELYPCYTDSVMERKSRKLVPWCKGQMTKMMPITLEVGALTMLTKISTNSFHRDVL